MSDMDGSSDLEEIWCIFGDECREHLGLVEACLLTLADRPHDSDQIAALFRSLHTVKGGARMMGLTTLEALAHRAEDMASLARDEGAPVDAEMVRLLLETLDQLRLLLDEVLGTHTDIELERVAGPVAALEAAIAARRRVNTPAAGEAAPPPALDGGADDARAVEADEAGLGPLGGEAGLWNDPIQVEPIDLATDPASVRIFFEMAEDELKAIQRGLEAFAGRGLPEGLERITVSAENLGYAAEQMGYQPLAEALARLTAAAASPLDASFDEDGFTQVLLTQVVAVEEALVTLRQGYAQPAAVSDVAMADTGAAADADVQTPPSGGELQDRASKEVLQGFLDMIGEMTGDQTTLNQLIARLSQADLLGDVFRILKGGQDSTRKLEAYLNQRMEDIAELARAEHRVSASLGRLQEMSSELGLSLDRTIVDGMVVRIGRVDYLAPIAAIQRIAGLSNENLVRASAEGRQLLFRMDEQLLPVFDLCAERPEDDGAGGLVVVMENEQRLFALRIDELVGQMRALVLPLEGRMSGIRHASGCFLHSDGKVGLVLAPERVE
jgi:chemotaxis protein histidine kinase CheA